MIRAYRDIMTLFGWPVGWAVFAMLPIILPIVWYDEWRQRRIAIAMEARQGTDPKEGWAMPSARAVAASPSSIRGHPIMADRETLVERAFARVDAETSDIPLMDARQVAYAVRVVEVAIEALRLENARKDERIEALYTRILVWEQFGEVANARITELEAALSQTLATEEGGE